jgi:hypothetical protein
LSCSFCWSPGPPAWHRKSCARHVADLPQGLETLGNLIQCCSTHNLSCSFHWNWARRPGHKNLVSARCRTLSHGLKGLGNWHVLIRRAKSRICLISSGVGRPGFGLFVCPLLAGALPPGFKSLGFTACFYSGSSLSRSFPGNGTARLALSADACRPSFSPCILSARARDRAVCLVCVGWLHLGPSVWCPPPSRPPHIRSVAHTRSRHSGCLRPFSRTRYALLE